MIPQSSNEFPGGLRAEAEGGRKEASPEIPTVRSNSTSPEKLKAASLSIRIDQPKGQKEPLAKEPSLEEILASIRKIVADDAPVAKSTGRSAARQPEAAAAPNSTTRAQKASAASAAESSVPPPPAKGGAGNAAVDAGKVASLISPAVEAEAATSFALLSQAVLNKNARTIEDLVQELLRPMLQKWLDSYLPGLVERLVQQEIQRISGRS